MFAKGYNIASQFTHPVIESMRFYNGTVDCVLGAFVVLNEEGWFVTVAHLLEPFMSFQKHQAEIATHTQQVKAIEVDSSLDAKQKRKRISRLQTNPKWITNHSFWWGMDGVTVTQMEVLGDGDLAVGQLKPFDPRSISQYPIIKKPDDLPWGTSLCKLGFPFHNPKALFDESTGFFTLAPGTLPVPRFPIDGIFTRNILAGKSKDGKYDLAFIETSTPGLRGQSGGPIFDVNGTVWAIQSRTHNLPLGFSPKIVTNGREVEENQFLNVGWGVHPSLLVAFLQNNKIKFQMSGY
jgi:hypothetical protein